MGLGNDSHQILIAFGDRVAEEANPGSVCPEKPIPFGHHGSPLLYAIVQFASAVVSVDP